MVYIHNQKNKKKSGFTLVEVMVATSLFIIVVLMSIQSLITVSRSNQLTQRVREQMDTISFVMEDMVRNVRLGTRFQCFDGSQNADISVPHSCPIVNPANGSQMSFKFAFEGFSGDSTDPNDQVVYWFNPDPVTGDYYLYKSKEGDGAITDAKFKKMTSALIQIDASKSGFSVFNAEQSDDTVAPDTVQTRILLRITGNVQYQKHIVPFNVQTTVSPRSYDS